MTSRVQAEPRGLKKSKRVRFYYESLIYEPRHYEGDEKESSDGSSILSDMDEKGMRDLLAEMDWRNMPVFPGSPPSD